MMYEPFGYNPFKMPQTKIFKNLFLPTNRRKVRNRSIDYALEARKAEHRRRKRKMQRWARRITRLHRK